MVPVGSSGLCWPGGWLFPGCVCVCVLVGGGGGGRGGLGLVGFVQGRELGACARLAFGGLSCR